MITVAKRERKARMPADFRLVEQNGEELTGTDRGRPILTITSLRKAANKGTEQRDRYSCVVETRNGFGRRPQPGEKGVIVLRLADVSKGYIDLSSPRQGQLTRDEIATYGLQTGDLLFVRVNGSSDFVGRAALVGPQHPDLVFNDHLIRVRLSAEVLPDFLRIYSDSPVARRHFVESASTSAGQLTINRDTLNMLPLPLPPLAEQRRLAARLRGQMDAAEKARAAAEAELAAINALPAALLRRAFNGEL